MDNMDATRLAVQEPAENLIQADQWDSQWSAISAPRPLRAWRDYVSWRFTELFRKYIKPGDRVLEVGCGGSRFLPYFARELKAEVWGLDFAAAGVQTARAALRRAGIQGTIVEGDLFSTASIPKDHFQVVFSAGFVEHFPDTVGVLRKIIQFAVPGTGLVITEIPNFCGMNGRIQRRVDRSFYDQHILLTPHALDEAHLAANAEHVQPAAPFGVIGLGCINFNRSLARFPGPVASLLMRSLEVPQFLLTAPFWLTRTRPESEAVSPFLMGVYRRRA